MGAIPIQTPVTLMRGQYVLNPYLGTILEFRDGETEREALVYFYHINELERTHHGYSPVANVHSGAQETPTWIPVSKIQHWDVYDTWPWATPIHAPYGWMGLPDGVHR